MSDTVKKDYLEELAGLDTGKAQPLFHPYPIINIFREDEPLKEENKKEKTIEEQLLAGVKGLICDGTENVKSQIRVNLEEEGAKFLGDDDIFSDDPKSPDFIIAMDADASFLKYAVTRGCPALKGTYGLVSRYGMDTEAPSLAQPAVSGANTAMLARVLQGAAGVDKKDPMSRDAYIYEYMEALKDGDLSGMKIAVLEAFPNMEFGEIELACYNHILDVLEEKGAEIDTVALDWIEYGDKVHEMIAACEKVMAADEISMSLLEEEEALSFGSYLLEEENYEKYYLKALKLRSLIKDTYDMLFREYALFIVPYTKEADPYSVGANIAGLPSMTLPYVSYDALTEEDEIVEAGVHMIAGANYENNLLKAAYIYEQEEF